MLTADICYEVSNGLLYAKPNGHGGKATVFLFNAAGEIIHVDVISPMKGNDRKKFIKHVTQKSSIFDARELETQLMAVAEQLANKSIDSAGINAPVVGDLPEIEVSQIVRPERFITPEVSGLAVPATVLMGERVIGQWFLYLRWSDGKRERRPLEATIELPDEGQLWIHPVPDEPAPSTQPDWSAAARRRWLDGQPAPKPAEVFKAICSQIAYFIDLPQGDAHGVISTLALWIMLTYCYPAWPAVPYLYIGGPLGSGKSRVLEILHKLVFRPLMSSSMTCAALFRTLHARGGTLLLDEAEQLGNTRDTAVAEVVAMLLAGYKRGGAATRLEPLGDGSFRTVTFDVFGPKALACIAGLPPVLASRCIPVGMFRAAPGSEKPKRRLDAFRARWQQLRDDLHALALEYGSTFLELAERSDVVPEGINGRQYELWQPLLGLAAWIEKDGLDGLLQIVQEHALRTTEVSAEEQTPDSDEVLLKILAEAVQASERLTPGDILRRAKEQEPELFKRWTAHGVRSHLARYGLRTNKSHGRKVYGRITLNDLLRIQASYRIDLGLHTATDPQPGESTPCTPCTPSDPP